MLQQAFSTATPEQRVAALLDRVAPAGVRRAGQALAARGWAGAHEAVIAATDPSVSRGAIGAAEAELIAEVLRTARTARIPALLLLDSSGARVDEGLAALGAFRRLYREAVQNRLSGVPMLALLGRACFGGASMLACACTQRSYLASTRLATSGPAVIEAAGGKAELDAADRDAVTRLMGAQTRVRLHPEDSVRADTLAAARDAAREFLASATDAGPDLLATQRVLEDRLGLRGAGATAETDDRQAARAAALLPEGYLPTTDGRLFRALPPAGSGKAVFAGVIGGAPVDARMCARLAAWLLDLGSSHPDSPVVLVLDADGHAARVADEQVLLSDFLAQLALVIGQLAQRGRRVVLWIPGAASGASYVAFAAGVDRVSALPSARLLVLPPGAAQSITGSASTLAASADEWIESGVADGLLDSRLERYAAIV